MNARLRMYKYCYSNEGAIYAESMVLCSPQLCHPFSHEKMTGNVVRFTIAMTWLEKKSGREGMVWFAKNQNQTGKKSKTRADEQLQCWSETVILALSWLPSGDDKSSQPKSFTRNHSNGRSFFRPLVWLLIQFCMWYSQRTIVARFIGFYARGQDGKAARGCLL